MPLLAIMYRNFKHLLPIVFLACGLAAEPLTPGSPLPAVTAPDHTGEPVSLGPDLDGWLLVYFYPRADTPGCTRQACSLRDAYTALREKAVSIYGVSMDTVADQKAFRDKYRLPFTLLADPEGTVVDAFGVPARSGFAARQAFLFKDGTLVWRDLSASTEAQAADVLAYLADQSAGS
ncbi:MAG: peroxiredoxin [Opitutales bacterium]